MSKWDYLKAVLHFALWRSWGIALTIATTLDILVPVISMWIPSWSTTLSVLPWRIALAVFLCLAIARLALAPYRMYKQQCDALHSANESLKQLQNENALLQADSSPMTVEKFDSFWNELVIHYAAYGHDEIFMDVTKKLRSLVHDNILHERIDDQLFPIDPVKGQLKDLVVIYSHGDTRCQMVQVKQRCFLTLPLSADDLTAHTLSRSVMKHLLFIAAQDDKEITARILIVERSTSSHLDAPAEPYCTCQMTLLNTSSFNLTLEGIEGPMTYAGHPLPRAPELVENQSIGIPHAGHLRISFRQWVPKSFADQFGNKRFELDTASLSVRLSYCNHEGVHKNIKKSIKGYPFTVDPIDSN